MLQALNERYLEHKGVSRLRFCINAAGDVIATAVKERYYVMVQDLKYSYRRLVANPGVAAIAILSLALGIGANTTMFSVIYAALLRPLPYPDSDRHVLILTTALNSPNKQNRSAATSSDFIDWQRQSTKLEDWHMFTGGQTLTATGMGLPERIVTQSVTPGLLDSLGVRPVIGRLFVPDEEPQQSALISEEYWTRRLGRQPDALGRKIAFEGKLRTIVGVVPARFELFDEPSRVDLWNEIDLSPGSNWIQRSMPWMLAAAKLKPGVTLEQAQSEMSSIAVSLASAYPETNRHRGVVVTPMLEARNGNLGTILYPLFGAVGFVLLIACANVANLLLARATVRQREISVRAALGASRGRLIREFLADGLVLAIPGVAAGLILAYGGIALFRVVAPQRFPGTATVELNLAALSFTAAAAILAGILSAIFPAITASKTEVTESLKEGGRGSAGRKRQRLRSLLVSAEIALALVLLVGAGLMISSVLHMQNHSLGFDATNVTVAQFELSSERYKKFAPKRDIDMRYVQPPVGHFIEHTLRELRSLPGVEYAALAGNVPMGPSEAPGVNIRVLGRSSSEPDRRWAQFNAVTDQFFEALRIPLLRGRYINARDVDSTVWVAVVNETFAREFFPNGDALGQVVTLTGAPDERPREIVGVVADHTQFTPKVPVQPEVFTSYFQQTREIRGNFQGQRFRPRMVVRSKVEGTPKPEVVTKIVADFDKDLGAFDVRPLDWYIANGGGPTRFYANILGLFSVTALLLATIGIYGLMSYSVTDRFHEIGIRLSLGATRANIVWLIVSYALKLSAVGLVIGVAGALAATRLLNTVLFGVQPRDPVTFSLVTFFLLAVAIAASALPALRATTIDAAVALRRE